MKIPFIKLHGLGNDWLAVAAEDLGPLRAREKTGSRAVPRRLSMLPDLARAICDRHTGIGADGLIIATTSASLQSEFLSEEARPKRARRILLAGADDEQRGDAQVRFFNADGSEAEMSGNGIRCAAAFLQVRSGSNLGYAAAETASNALPRLRPLRILTVSGVRSVVRVSGRSSAWVFRATMGSPVLDPAKIPFGSHDLSAPIIDFSLRLSGATLPVTVTSMGNPHCSVFVDDFQNLDWQALGREIERHPLFPKRTNVEFVKVVSRKEIDVRFWERGVGETQSSGTGSCAAVVACILKRATGRAVRVDTVAGSLEVAWPQDDEVSLTGPVAVIAEGTYYYRVPLE